MRRTLALLLFTAALGTAVKAEAPAPDVKLTTLEWPPYVLADGSGPNTHIVIETLRRAGYAPRVRVFPWNRALALAKSSPDWIGLFPEYYAVGEDAEAGGERCIYSKPFGSSPVGILHRKDEPVTFRSHADLSAYVIGVVRGYQNEARLDAMIADGEIQVELAENDAGTIKMVAARRTHAGVIDKNVFEYLKAHDPAVAEVADELEFHPKLLVDHTLHVCFENSPAGRNARDAFDAALVPGTQ